MPSEFRAYEVGSIGLDINGDDMWAAYCRTAAGIHQSICSFTEEQAARKLIQRDCAAIKAGQRKVADHYIWRKVDQHV